MLPDGRLRLLLSLTRAATAHGPEQADAAAGAAVASPSLLSVHGGHLYIWRRPLLHMTAGTFTYGLTRVRCTSHSSPPPSSPVRARSCACLDLNLP